MKGIILLSALTISICLTSHLVSQTPDRLDSLQLRIDSLRAILSLGPDSLEKEQKGIVYREWRDLIVERESVLRRRRNVREATGNEPEMNLFTQDSILNHQLITNFDSIKRHCLERKHGVAFYKTAAKSLANSQRIDNISFLLKHMELFIKVDDPSELGVSDKLAILDYNWAYQALSHLNHDQCGWLIFVSLLKIADSELSDTQVLIISRLLDRSLFQGFPEKGALFDPYIKNSETQIMKQNLIKVRDFNKNF